MTNGAAAMDFSAEENRALVVLSETMKTVCYKYDTDFLGLEKLQKSGAWEKLAVSVDFLYCDPLNNLMQQSELEKKAMTH